MNAEKQPDRSPPDSESASRLGQILASRAPAIRIAVIYGIFGSLWILFSDAFVEFFTDNPETLSTIQTYKGLVYIIITTLGLYVLVLIQTRMIRARQQLADKRARLQETLAHVSKKALEKRSPKALNRYILDQVASYLEADIVKLVRVDPGHVEEEEAQALSWQAGNFNQVSIPISPEYLAGYVIREQRAVIIENHDRNQPFKAPQYLIDEGVVSSLVAPILNESPLGVLGAHYIRPHSFDQSEKDFLQSIANLLGQAMLRFRAQEDLRMHSKLLDSVGQAVIATDPDGRIFYWNPAAESMYGWTALEALGRNVQELTPALGQYERAAGIMDQMRSGNSWEGEFRLRRKDGAEFFALVRNNVLRDEAGEIQAIIGITTDITEIKKTQRALQKATARLNLLHQVDQHILSGTKMEETAQAVLEALKRQIPFGSSLVLEYEAGGDRVHKLASINDPTSFNDMNWLPMNFLGMPTQQELPPDPFIYFPNIEQVTKSDSVYEEWLNAGQNSLLVARMLVEDQAYGSIVLSRAEVNAFSEEEIELLCSVANSLAVGLHEEQLREAERKRAIELESLQRVSLSLVSELDLDKLLFNTVSAAFDLLSADDASLYLYDPESDTLDLAGGRSTEGFLQGTRHQPRDDGVTFQVARSGQRAVYSQVADHELFHNQYPDWKGSLISQPITYRGVVLGVLHLGFLRQQHFSATDLLIVELLADKAAVAISNARQYEQLDLGRRESEALFRITQRLAGEYQLYDVLDAIVFSVTDVLEGAEASSIWLGNEGDKVLQVQAWHGHDDQVMNQLSIPRGQSVIGKVIDEGQPIMIEDTSSSDLFEPFGDASVDSIKCMIGVPIWIGQTVVGAIFADAFSQPNAFGQRDFRMLVLLANQAAVAIERARLFQQISDSRKRAEQLSIDLVQVQEEERARLARELHDEIGQLLTGLKLTLEMGQEQLNKGEIPDLATPIDISEDLLTEVRDLSLRLRPSMLDDLGLLPTLFWLSKRAEEQMGLAVEISHDGIEDRRFNEQIETTAYRVAQESLTNVARHAEVDKAWLSVRMEDDQLMLQVRDEGIGFDSAEVSHRESALGLAGMRERAQLLGGKLGIISQPGNGTTIRLILPINRAVESRIPGRRL